MSRQSLNPRPERRPRHPRVAALISGLKRRDQRGGLGRRNDVFVGADGDGTIGTYTAAGVPITTALITALTPEYLAVVGSDLYVADFGGSVQQFTTAGVLVNSSLVSGLNQPLAIAVVPEPSTCAAIFAAADALALRRRQKKS